MSPKPITQIETSALINEIQTKSFRVAPNPMMPKEIAYAETLRQACLNTFKNVNKIHSESSTRDSKISRKLVSQFKSQSYSSTTANADKMQEALASMHREITNLITGALDNKGRLRIAGGETTFNKRLIEIVDKAMSKMPQDSQLKSPLKEHMEGIKATIKGCTEDVVKHHRANRKL